MARSSKSDAWSFIPSSCDVVGIDEEEPKRIEVFWAFIHEWFVKAFGRSSCRLEFVARVQEGSPMASMRRLASACK